MAEGFGRLETDPLFLGLTRPAMLLGVTYTWFAFNAFIWVLYFIQTSNFKGIALGGGVVHLIGYMACSYEPRFVELFMVNMQTNTKCMNKRFHGNTSSFDPI